MCKQHPAFGRRLEDLVQLGAIEFRPEPLDGIVERRLKAIWAARSCPHCEAESLQALDGSDRIWCGRCNWKSTYTRGTPFYNSELARSEFRIVGCSASIRSRSSSHRVTRRSTTEFGSLKPPFSEAFRLSGRFTPRQSVDRHRSMKPSRCVPASKAKIRHGKGSAVAVHPKVVELDGRENRETN